MVVEAPVVESLWCCHQFIYLGGKKDFIGGARGQYCNLIYFFVSLGGKGESHETKKKNVSLLHI